MEYDFKLGDVVMDILTGETYTLYKFYPKTGTAIIYYGRHLNDDGQYIDKSFFYSEILPVKKEEQMKTYQCERNNRVSNEARAFLKTIDNLNQEVNKAGGVGWTLEELEDMTAADLLCTLCTNDIKFKYER